MNQIRAMQAFVRCVERASFSAVATEFSTTQPTISKLIAGLEAHLGGTLFERATRGVRLTPQGQNYYPHCKEIVDAIAVAEEGFGRAQGSVSGLVRISASFAFGRLQLIPQLPALMRRYPLLEIDLQLNDRPVDLVADGVDLAFRLGQLEDSSLLARRVGTSRRDTVASPAYLRKHGTPQVPADLAQHQCIRFDTSGAGAVWRYLPALGAPEGLRAARVSVAGRLRTNSPESARESALAGMGIAQISQWMTGPDLKARRLVRLLPDYRLDEVPIHAVSLPSARHAARVRAVVDFFEAVFRQDGLLATLGP